MQVPRPDAPCLPSWAIETGLYNSNQAQHLWDSSLSRYVEIPELSENWEVGACMKQLRNSSETVGAGCKLEQA